VPNGIPKKTKITGDIQVGDYEKFIAFIKKPSPTTGFPDAMFSLSRIELSGTSGSFTEAIKIASLLKKFNPLVDVEETCSGPCFLLWLSGAQRHVGLKSLEVGGAPSGRIGVNGAVLTSTESQQVKADHLDEVVKNLGLSYRTFTLEQGLPASVLDRLSALAVADTLWLKAQDLQLIGSSPPHFAEKVRATCYGMESQVKESETDTGLKVLARCVNGLNLNEQIVAVDAVLGPEKPSGWDFYKRRLLETGSLFKEQSKEQKP
jgi:hypothetical protein